MAARHDDDDERDYDDAAGYDDDDEGGDGDGEGGRIRSLSALSDALDALADKVERALSGGGRGPARPGYARPTAAQSAEERRKEIRDELAALRAQERADAERGELVTRLGKVEKALERPPRQLRKIEQFMGWHR